MWSSISCRASLSAVQMKTSSPRSSPRRARVAITSSASTPGCISDRDPEPLEDAPDHGDLGDEVVGHRASVGLVVGEELGAEDRPGSVEGRRQIVGLAVPEQVEQVPEDPEDGVRRLSRGPGHRVDGMEDLVDQRERVEDVERRPELHRNAVTYVDVSVGEGGASPAHPPRQGAGPGDGEAPASGRGSRPSCSTHSRSICAPCPDLKFEVFPSSKSAGQAHEIPGTRITCGLTRCQGTRRGPPDPGTGTSIGIRLTGIIWHLTISCTATFPGDLLVSTGKGWRLHAPGPDTPPLV